MQSIRVLFVEDREDDVLLVMRELRRNGFDISSERVDTPEAMRERLRTNGFDVVISDYSMPQFSAVDALQILQASGLDLPFIIVSGTVGEEVAVHALKSGAHDYIPKDNLKRLTPALERELREAASRRERRRAERDLRASSHTIAAAFSASPVPMILLDADYLVTKWNDAAERVFGWRSEEVIGQALPFMAESEPRRYRDAVGELLRSGLRTMRITGRDMQLRRKDGSEISVLLSAGTFADEDGQTLGSVVILIDVTEQRALQEQLRQSQKMEAIGRLAGGIAHDFNNVLTAISGYAALLLGNIAGEDERRHDVEEILAAAERAASFTRQLLAFSRKQITQSSQLELNGLVSSLRNLLARIIGEHVHFNVDLDEAALFIHADKSQVEQVVINLVVNARDAVEGRDRPTINLRTFIVRLTEEEAAAADGVAPGSYCAIAVEDNGTGIDPAALPHIFEPFFTTKEAGKGTGLGLSTVYGIVKQSHGLIRIRSDATGTAFTVLLPFSDAGEPEPAEAPDETRPVARRVRAMLVEDDTAIRTLVSRLLTREGYEVVSAPDPLEALAMLDGLPEIDLVLSDVMLPNMNGRDFARAAQKQRPAIRVLLMSGYVDEGMEVEFPYIEKPFNPKHLIAKIAEVMGSP